MGECERELARQSSGTGVRSALPEQLLGIQYLRGAAALCVVVHHASNGGFPLAGTAIRLFFVISGFLMFAISDTGQRPGPFLRDRIVRIVPNYWLATSLAVAWFAIGDPGMFAPRIKWFVASYLFVPMRDPARPTVTVNPILPQGWTLDYEMFFYLLIALLLFLPRRARLTALTVSFVALALVGRSWPGAPTPIAVWTDLIIANFLVGAWLWAAWNDRSPPLILAGLAILLGVGFPLLIRFQDIVGTILLALLAGLTVGGVLLLDRAKRVPQWRIPTLLGDASYSIYLWHLFPLWVGQHFGREMGLPEWAIGIVAGVSGVALGLAAYLWIERPLLDLMRRRRHALRDAKGAAIA